jgi:hypothetical protein
MSRPKRVFATPAGAASSPEHASAPSTPASSTPGTDAASSASRPAAFYSPASDITTPGPSPVKSTAKRVHTQVSTQHLQPVLLLCPSLGRRTYPGSGGILECPREISCCSGTGGRATMRALVQPRDDPTYPSLEHRRPAAPSSSSCMCSHQHSKSGVKPDLAPREGLERTTNLIQKYRRSGRPGTSCGGWGYIHESPEKIMAPSAQPLLHHIMSTGRNPRILT